MNDSLNERRKSLRLTYPATIHCSQYIAEGKIVKYESHLEIEVLNIASEGLCIATTEFFKERTILDFEILLEDKLYKSLSAEIIWSIKKENIYNYGLRIMNITGKFGTHVFKIENGISIRV